MKRILLIVNLIIFTAYMVGCQSNNGLSDKEYLDKLNDIVNHKYILENELYQSYEIYTLYNENEELAYYLIEFSPVGFIVVLIDDDTFSSYTVDECFDGWYRYSIQQIVKEEGLYITINHNYVWEEDANGNKVKYYNSPYYVANKKDERKYLLEIENGNYFKIYVPAVKRGDKFLNLISMEEFDYFPIRNYDTTPHLMLDFDDELK